MIWEVASLASRLSCASWHEGTFQKVYKNKLYFLTSNRVGGGVSPPSSHTTVRTVRYTAVR